MVSVIYVMLVGGGEVKRLTHDRGVILGNLAWTPDSKEVVFSSTRGGTPNLWRIIPPPGGSPKAVSGGSVNAINPAISQKGNLLAYEQTLFQSNILRVTLANGKSRPGAPVPIAASKGLNGRPQLLLSSGRRSFLNPLGQAIPRYGYARVKAPIAAR